MLFLLLCTSARALLETVVSRCTVFTLNAPCTADALKALKDKSAESDEEKAVDSADELRQQCRKGSCTA